MQLGIDKKSPFPIKEQIKRQIRHLIETGQLKPGDALPSARDLAAYLSVNRNTVSQVYRELADQKFLRVAVGAGTFVRQGRSTRNMAKLKRIMDNALAEAKMLGFDTAQATDVFLNQLLSYTASIGTGRVLVVDCNHEVIDHICHVLEQELEVDTRGILIQTLEKNAQRAADYAQGVDLVVCGFNHFEELTDVLPEKNRPEITAVMLRADVRVMDELLRLPPGARVGYCCANQRSTETFYNSSFFSAGRQLHRILVGLDRPDELRKMLSRCDVIFATCYVYDRVREMVEPGKRLVRVDLSVDSGSIELIRERLNALRKENAGKAENQFSRTQ